MENNEKQTFGFFSEIQGLLWKMIAGLVSFAVVVPFFIDQSENILGIPAKPGFAICLLFYFLSPLVFFVIWFSKREQEGFKQTLNKTPIIGYYYYAWLIYALIAALALIFPFSPVLSSLFYGCSLLFILSVFVYIGYTLKLYRSSNCSNIQDDRNDPCTNYGRRRKQVLNEYFVLVTITGLIAILYFINAFFKTESPDKWYVDKEKYDLGFYMKDLNTNQIGPLDKSVQEKNNDLIRIYGYEFIEQCHYPGDTNYICYEAIVEPLKKTFSNLDTLRKIARDTPEKSWSKDSITSCRDSLTKQIQEINGLIKNTKPAKVSLTDIRNFESILNIPKAISQKADLIYSISWAGILGTVQLKGLFLFFIVLVFLLTAWFHAHLANLSEQCLAAKARYKEGNDHDADLKLVTGEEIRKILEKPTFSEIRTIKIFISVIILLIIPIFKPVTKEKIRLDKPLWQFTLPNLLIGDKNPISVKPEESLREIPAPGSSTTYPMDTAMINNAVRKHDAKIMKEVDRSISSSVDLIYDKLKGAPKK